ncbi:unnamed protein product [Diamesa hyperborea]
MKEITPDKEDKIKSDHGDKNVKSKKTKKEGFLSKVIIRKLPPNMTEEEFIKSIDPIPDHDYLYFVPVDWTLGTEATSRAYIHFLNPEDIFIFKDKFDGYVFVDSMRGTEYPAIVEFAPFQGLPKSRGRKKDKNANTIEEEPHYINFLESLKTEEADGQKPEPKLEYSYQIKDDKKITSTPLLEFIANKYQEKRDQKRKKNDDRKKNRDDEKQKKKIQIAKHIPESIKEEIVYDDGVVIRTVPRMERRDNRNKNEKKNDNTTDKDKDKDKERGGKNREKDKERQNERRKLNREREKERKSEQREQKAKQKLVNDEKNPDVPKVPTEAPAKTAIVEKDRPVVVDTTNKDDVPAKKEIKRYSQQRKERYGNEPKSTEITQSSNVEKDSLAIQEKPVEQKQEKAGEKEHRSHRNSEKTPRTPQEEAEKSELSEKRLKRVQEQKERRAREADERAQRRIKNKDRPAIQIYQPKRRGPGTSSTGKADNSKSSDESCASNKKAEPERKVTEEKREPEKKPYRKNSREESSRKNSREEPIRKNSREEPIRKNSRDESHRKKLPTGSRKNSFESQKSLESNEGKEKQIEIVKIMKQSNGGDIRQVPVKVFPNDTIPVQEEHDLIPMKIIGHTENDGSIFPNQLIIDAPAVPKEPQMLNLNLIS